MKCPYCGAEDSKVIDSRPTEDSERIRRRRECLNCHMRFTTYEVVETVPLIVIKKDNSREPFDRQKLLNAMLRACAKRPVSYESLERAVSSIEQTLMSTYDREVTSVRIGELTMQELKKIDMTTVIRGMLSYEQQNALDTLAPASIKLPAGRTARIEYRRGAEAPVVRARLQDCFGLKSTPRLDGGKRPVLMELLSPGFKPVQLTQDMEGFWKTTYFEVRKELRRRYPKHAWPDNP